MTLKRDTPHNLNNQLDATLYLSRTSSMRSRGALLLEILVGLSIFIITAVYVLSGLSTSLTATARTELQAKAGDLRVTFDSELQMGLREMVSAGPESFDTGDDIRDQQLEGWTWQLIVEEPENLPDIQNIYQVELIIRYEPEGVVVRRGRYVWLDPNAPTPEEVAEANAAAEEAEASGEGVPEGLPGGTP